MILIYLARFFSYKFTGGFPHYKFIYDKFVYTMEIQPETRLKSLPETADSLLKRGKVYRDYSFEELKELCGENEDNDGK